MNLLNWIGLLWLLVVPALLLLYMLRPLRVRKQVPSLRLWHAIPRVERTHTNLRRPPLSLLLILEIIALAAGAFALAQPALTAPASRSTVVILDASGSMQALDKNESRFNEAVDQARKIVDAMSSSDVLTLLRAGANVTAVCSACNRIDAERSLSALTPGAGSADIAGALAVASGLAPHAAQGAGNGAGSLSAVVISDGEFAPPSVDGLDFSLRYIQVGSPVDDVAITTLSARRPPDGQSGYVAFASIDNLGASDVTIQVAAQADTVPLPTRSETVPAGGNVGITWQVAAGTARFTVNVTPSDALPADDRAVIFLPVAGQYQVNVTSSQPDLYARALASIDGLQAFTNTTVPGPAFSIIQGKLPTPLPAGNLLLVVPSGDLINPSGTMSGVRPTVVDVSHPLLEGIDLNALLVSDANVYQPPSWLETLVDSPKGPLLLAGGQDGRRIVVLTFDPQQSNLPKLAAFPLLVANAVDWLDPLAGTQAVDPGQTLQLAPGSTVQTPSGRTLVVGAPGLFTDTDEEGIYRVLGPGSSTQANTTPQQFAVNMADNAQSSTDNPQSTSHPELKSPGRSSRRADYRPGILAAAGGACPRALRWRMANLLLETRLNMMVLSRLVCADRCPTVLLVALGART